MIVDEDPWNKERLPPHQMQSPNIPKLLIPPSQAAPFATSHNLKTIVVWISTSLLCYTNKLPLGKY
jgi:hypothetical protein